jgi:spore coat polysaccharide biosynthesis protein SpsF
MRDTAPVVAVIQARMSSSRLPGKVLTPVAGKPLLWHIVHRLSRCRTIDRIVVATSVDASDDAIEAFCTAEGIARVRGPLDNVLERYRIAAEETGAGTLLRVTGDSPLVDPDFTDYLVTMMFQARADFVVLEPGAMCAHEGVDVFSRHALDWLVGHAANDPVAREHVTSYFKLHPDAVRTAVIPPFEPLTFPHARISIDTADDLALIRALYEKFGAAPGELPLIEALQLLRDEPSYRQINAHVRQKGIHQAERHALICCQGGRSAGLGHVRRSLSLARALRDSQGFGVVIGLHGDAEVAGMIRAAAFEAVPLETVEDLETLARTKHFSAAVVDVKDWLTRDDVAMIARQISPLAVIDDGSDRRFEATHAYYPPTPQARELSWSGSSCRPRIGWEWCVLGFDTARSKLLDIKGEEPFRIVVSMGGADPLNLTTLVLEALQRVGMPFEAYFIVGPVFADAAALALRIHDAGKNFHVLTGVTDLAPVFSGVALAVVAFGVTAYELAALGVPAVYLAISNDHARAASAFVAAGLGFALPERASCEQIAGAVRDLIANEGQRRSMRAAGPKIVDGHGAWHVAADLVAAIGSSS